MKLEGKFVQVPHSLYKDPRLSSDEKLVWSALMIYADDEGLCWPKITTLAEDTGLCERTVRIAIKGLKIKGRKAIKGLEEHGWLKVRVRKGVSSLYRLVVPEASPRNKSGDISVALPNEVSMLSSGTSAVSHTGLQEKKGSVYAASGDECGVTHLTSAVSHTDELYSLNYTQKINRETSSKMTRTKQSQSPDFSGSFNEESGRFVLGAALRQKFEEDYPDADFDKSLRLYESNYLSQKDRKPIVNIPSYLRSCFEKHAVRKAGALIHFDDGSTGRVKVYTDEELDQREQREKARLSSPVSKAIEDLAAKWRSS